MNQQETQNQLPWNVERECDYCVKSFTPKRKQDRLQRFCCPDHRKRFFEYGAKLKIVAALSRVFDKRFAEFEKRIAALERENKLLRGIDAKAKHVVTLQHELQ